MYVLSNFFSLDKKNIYNIPMKDKFHEKGDVSKISFIIFFSPSQDMRMKKKTIILLEPLFKIKNMNLFRGVI